MPLNNLTQKATDRKVERKTNQLTPAQKEKAATKKTQLEARDARQVSNLKNLKVSDDTKKAFNTSNQTSATGLEKAIFIAGDNMIKAQKAVNTVFNGKPQAQTGANEKKSIKKALDKGLYKIFGDLEELDLCNLLDYALNRIPGSSRFDPEVRPTDSFELSKWLLQKKAYDLQTIIDDYYDSYLDTSNAESKARGVYGVIEQIRDIFNEVISPVEQANSLRDPFISAKFPQLDVINATLENYFGEFNKYTDFRQIPSTEIQKLIGLIDKVRNICVLIQGLNSPAAALSFVDSVFPNADIKNQLQKLVELIPVEKLSPFLHTLVKNLQKLQSICNVFSSFISFGQQIIGTMVVVVNALKIIVNFIKALPIPLVFQVQGVVHTIDDILQNIVIKFLNKILGVLRQISVLLQLCAAVVEELSIGLFRIISVLSTMIDRLKGCTSRDKKLIQEMETQRDNLLDTANGFESFVDNYRNNEKTTNNSVGEYLIQIVTEEVVDDAINLRRRYGIAQKLNGPIVARSQATFASEDQIIINEVKQLLSTLGLIQPENLSSFSLEELQTIEEALKFLSDNEVTITDVTFDNGLDAPENEDENSGLGLNAFVNKLKGGKKLRNKMREAMKKNAEQLKAQKA
jgi:hypothetical protein